MLSVDYLIVRKGLFDFEGVAMLRGSLPARTWRNYGKFRVRYDQANGEMEGDCHVLHVSSASRKVADSVTKALAYESGRLIAVPGHWLKKYCRTGV